MVQRLILRDQNLLRGFEGAGDLAFGAELFMKWDSRGESIFGVDR